MDNKVSLETERVIQNIKNTHPDFDFKTINRQAILGSLEKMGWKNAPLLDMKSWQVFDEIKKMYNIKENKKIDIKKLIKEEIQNYVWPMDEWKLKMKKQIESLEIGIENTDENLVISVCEEIIRMTKKLQDFED